MSTLIGSEQVVETPLKPDEMINQIELIMLQTVSLSLIAQNDLLRLQREQLAAQAAIEAEAWGKIMQKVRELNTL